MEGIEVDSRRATGADAGRQRQSSGTGTGTGRGLARGSRIGNRDWKNEVFLVDGTRCLHHGNPRLYSESMSADTRSPDVTYRGQILPRTRRKVGKRGSPLAPPLAATTDRGR